MTGLKIIIRRVRERLGIKTDAEKNSEDLYYQAWETRRLPRGNLKMVVIYNGGDLKIVSKDEVKEGMAWAPIPADLLEEPIAPKFCDNCFWRSVIFEHDGGFRYCCNKNSYIDPFWGMNGCTYKQEDNDNG